MNKKTTYTGRSTRKIMGNNRKIIKYSFKYINCYRPMIVIFWEVFSVPLLKFV